MAGSSSWADEAEREDAERKQTSLEQKKKKVNPFGDAKPREVVLTEKGVDWRKKDMELQRRSVSRPESEEEKILKEEIRALEEVVKSTVANDCGKGGGDGQRPDSEHRESLEMQLAQKENELQQLTLHLNDKIRFPQRSDRPTFRSGYLDSDTGPDLRKRGFRLEPLDLAENCGAEMPGALHGRGGLLSISDGEWLSGVTLRTGDFTRGLESERQGSFSGRGNKPRSQNSRSYKQASHLEHGELVRHREAGRSGSHSGNDNSFQGNGQERPGCRSGHSDVIIRTDSEKMGSFSRNSDQGYYTENLGLGSRQSDVPGWESRRRTYGSGGSGYDSDRHSCRSEQEYDVKGYAFERSGICGGHDEIPKNHGNERPGSRSGHRDFLRPCDAECPCGHVEAEMCGAFHETYYPTSGKRNTERPVSIFDSGRLGPLPPGQADIGRGHGFPYRRSGGRVSGQDQGRSRREYHVAQQYDGRGKRHNGVQQDNRRGREYRGIQQHDRRPVSSQQKKIDQTRGIWDDHLDYY